MNAASAESGTDKRHRNHCSHARQKDQDHHAREEQPDSAGEQKRVDSSFDKCGLIENDARHEIFRYICEMRNRVPYPLHDRDGVRVAALF